MKKLLIGDRKGVIIAIEMIKSKEIENKRRRNTKSQLRSNW